MNLIVDLGVTYETLSVSEVHLILKQSYGVLVSHCVVLTIDTTPSVAAIDATLLVREVYGLGGVELNSLRYRASVSKAVIHNHTLTVKVDSKVVVQQYRVKVNRESVTRHIRCLQSTILIQITVRDTVGKVVLLAHLDIAGERYITLVRLSELIDLALPIGVDVVAVSVGVLGSRAVSISIL